MTEAQENRFYRELGRKIRAGQKPPELNRPIICRECGPVWSMAPASILSDSCFWCGNRLSGRKIPRPPVSIEMKKILQDLGFYAGPTGKSSNRLHNGFASTKYLQDKF